jgi:hypothetical protein
MRPDRRSLIHNEGKANYGQNKQIPLLAVNGPEGYSMGPPKQAAVPKRPERKCSLTDVLGSQSKTGLKSAAATRRLEKMANGVESQQRIV